MGVGDFLNIRVVSRLSIYNNKGILGYKIQRENFMVKIKHFIFAAILREIIVVNCMIERNIF